MYRLHKTSNPGWIKEFGTEDEVCQQLWTEICPDCLAGNSFWDDVACDYVEKEIDENNMYDLLNTACGMEYRLEELE